MLLFDVTNEFNKQLRLLCKASNLNEERTNFLMNHVRKRIALEKVCGQVLSFEHRYRARLTIERKNLLIKEAAKMFAMAAIKQKTEELMTDAQKSAISKTDPVKEEMAENFKEIDGKATYIN